MFFLILPLFLIGTASATEDGLCSELGCSHSCKENKSAPQCTCPDYLILGADSKTCEEPASLLFLTTRGLKLLNERQSQNEVRLVLDIKRSYAFDFYFSKKEIYAYGNYKIVRYSFADSNLTSSPMSVTPIVEVDTRVTSITVDWEHSRLYWLCTQRTLIESAGTDGSGRKELVSYPSEDQSPAEWDDIIVDPYAEKLFWLGLKGLYRSDLKGQYTITNSKLHLQHLTLDIANQLMYVVAYNGYEDSDDKVVVKFHYDGSQAGEEISIGQRGRTIHDLGVFDQQLYWQSSGLGENIYKADISKFYSGRKGNATVVLVEEMYDVVHCFKIYGPTIQKPPKVIK